MNLGSYLKSFLGLSGVSLLGFTTGSVIGRLLFGPQKSIDEEIAFALGAVVMSPLSYSLILPLLFPLLSIMMKSCIVLGIVGVAGASIVWLKTANRGALAVVAVTSAMLGLPNSIMFEEALTL